MTLPWIILYQDQEIFRAACPSCQSLHSRAEVEISFLLPFLSVSDPYSPFLLHFLTMQCFYALPLPLGPILHIPLHIRRPPSFICLPNLLCSLLCVCAFGCVLYLLHYDTFPSIPRDTSSPPPLFIDLIHHPYTCSSFPALFMPLTRLRS